ncbi:MAG: EAL domain-containing protein [Rhodocyclaceae bacterium]|nr:MAG: EAL domain-containing protein [Rhodocyclaceae bacterium]
MLHDNHSLLRAVQDLKDLGLALSIDDFGTGYSNLGYLRKFNADKLKIDQSFVRAMDQEKDGLTLVKTIIQMANNLQMHCVAEGVETDRQMALLGNLGCGQIQGYHISRPLRPEAFVHFLRSQ